MLITLAIPDLSGVKEDVEVLIDGVTSSHQWVTVKKRSIGTLTKGVSV